MDILTAGDWVKIAAIVTPVLIAAGASLVSNRVTISQMREQRKEDNARNDSEHAELRKVSREMVDSNRELSNDVKALCQEVSKQVDGIAGFELAYDKNLEKLRLDINSIRKHGCGLAGNVGNDNGHGCRTEGETR